MTTQFPLITINPAVLGGKPTFAGTRIGVDMIIQDLSNGRETKDILGEYPSLTKEHISQALAFSTYLIRNEDLVYA